MPVTEVWLINGIPGAGKSTVAQCLARSLPRAAHVEGDRLHELILSGKVLPGQDPPEESAAQIYLCVRNQCLLAQSFARAGFVPILDYVVVNRRGVEEYLSQLPGSTLRLVTLAPGTEVALARDRARPEKTVAAAWTHLDEVMRRELAGVGLWVDNKALSVEETVAYLLHAQERARVGAP
jgi:predicted kinase